MPHHESPPMAPSIMVSSKDAAPSTAAVDDLTKQIYTSKTSQASLDAANALTDTLLNSVGFRGLAGYGMLADLLKAASDKKNPARREGA
ncbi:[NU+] prion formation protein 1, partial [Teratosphaeriaceae sp. CCFEE 6253]